VHDTLARFSFSLGFKERILTCSQRRPSQREENRNDRKLEEDIAATPVL
jgi:hypothetical protein